MRWKEDTFYQVKQVKWTLHVKQRVPKKNRLTQLQTNLILTNYYTI